MTLWQLNTVSIVQVNRSQLIGCPAFLITGKIVCQHPNGLEGIAILNRDEAMHFPVRKEFELDNKITDNRSVF